MARPQVKFVKALWGMESTPHPEAAKKIAAAGFTAIEAPADAITSAVPFSDEGLGVVAMLFPTTLDELKAGLDKAARLNPVIINVHAGKDWWTLEEGIEFLSEAVKLSAPAPFYFETHRGRLFHQPSSAKALLEAVPEVKITADFSHWTCVCESLMPDQREAMDLAIARTGYIHSRVGHENGPQVPDPRAPEWQDKVEHFCCWWDQILDSAGEQGTGEIYVDVEFGPPTYMPTIPYTREPTADLWDICVWMRDHLQDRWK